MTLAWLKLQGPDTDHSTITQHGFLMCHILASLKFVNASSFCALTSIFHKEHAQETSADMDF